MTKRTRYILGILLVLLIIIAATGYNFYKKIYFPNISIKGEEKKYLYIRTGSEFNEVITQLSEQNMISDTSSFIWLAIRTGYHQKVKAGRYLISDNMSNKELISLLRSGRQDPVRLVFNNVRLKEQLAGLVSKQIEADSASLILLMNDDRFWKGHGVNSESSLTFFIPNTYEFYWNTSSQGFVDRMIREHKNFWTDSRRQKTKRTKLTKTEVSILASIVEQETRMVNERPIVAGVYVNRLQKNWKLEADPTLVYANRAFDARRVLNTHKEIDSPYNTYKNFGLPPGPICIPSISSIDAVLNFKEHDYMFFCAKDDFSGYHSFAKSYNEHLSNARRFQKELNRRKIKS